MAGYAIFIPGVKGANTEHLVNVGLAALLKDGGPEFADVLDHGPGGGRGVLATWRTLDCPEQSLSAGDYDWQPAKASKALGLAAERYWFGVMRDRGVSPKHIARKEGVAGYPITLNDDQVWCIPSAQHLPTDFGLNADGEFEAKIAGEYREFWQQSEKYAIQFFQAADRLELLQAKRPNIQAVESVEFTLADAWDYCCQALAINYRVTPEIVDFLGLLDSVSMRNIVKTTIDLTAILEVEDQKKSTDVLSIPVGLNT